MGKASRALVLATSMMILGACASLTRGTTEPFVVETSPPGATVTLSLSGADGSALSCSPTPCAIEVPRKSQFVARVDLPDHQGLRIVVRSRGESAAALLVNGGAKTGALGVPPTTAMMSGSGVGAAAFATATGFFSGAIGTGIIAPGLLIDTGRGSLNSVYPNPVSAELMPLDKDIDAVRIIDPNDLETLSLEDLRRLAETPAT